jgi:chromosome partitioning protein
MYHSLERFLFTLKLPFVTSFRDTQFYNKSIEKGIGVLDMKTAKTHIDHEQWAPLIRWLDTPIEKNEAEIRPLFSEKVSS